MWRKGHLMATRIGERPLVLGLGLAVILALLCGFHRLGQRLQPVEDLERLSLDTRFWIRGPEAPGESVALVVIDDKTIRRYPDLAERRAPFAKLITAIASAKATVIGIDGILADPEHLLGEQLERDIHEHVQHLKSSNTPSAHLLKRIDEAISGDRKLEQAIRTAGTVVLGLSLGRRGEPLPDDPALRKGRYDQSLRGAVPPVEANRGLASLPELNAAALALGSITLIEDRDQAVRELGFARAYAGAVYVPLVVPLIAAFERAPQGSLAYRAGAQQVRIGDRTIELTGDHLILNYRGPDQTFATYSAADVIDGQVGDALAKKIVIVGITYLGSDRVRSPFGPRLPALEVHATAIDNILAGDPIKRASPILDIFLCFLAGLLTALLFHRRLNGSPGLRFGGLAVLTTAFLGSVQIAFASAQLWLGVVWPMTAIVAIGSLGIATAYAGEARQRRWLRQSFSQYLGEDTMAELLTDPDAPALGGARRRLSVLFSDIRNFTSISERLSPEELVDILNAFLTPMTGVVLERGGYLDKYIGDAVMAVFGAPVRHQDHAARALNTAIAMHNALDRINPRFVERGFAPFAIGVGINTGDVVVGNMGSTERFDYTVVGDAVNLASRLEGLTKVYETRCLVGEETWRELGGPQCSEFSFREVDRVRVKGKVKPVALFELLRGPEGTLVDYENLPDFAKALTAYRNGDFTTARACFTNFAEKNPDDQVTALYLARLDEMGGEVPVGWDGVTSFQNK